MYVGVQVAVGWVPVPYYGSGGGGGGGGSGGGLTQAGQHPRDQSGTACVPVINLATLVESRPEEFYLPDAELEQLSDCFAVVGGAGLPLHSQVLGVQSIVLRDLFVAQQETDIASKVGALSPLYCACDCIASPIPTTRSTTHTNPLPCVAVLLQDPVCLSVAFDGAGLRETACFLRLMYSPDEANPTSLAALEFEELVAVAGLAHKLNAGRLLGKIDTFLQGTLL